MQTGTRLVGILLDKQVPRSVTIGGFNCKTWYRGQPVTCDLCGDEGHVLSNCPIRGKCRRCREPGHFARDCPHSPWKAPSASAPASGSVDPTPAKAAATSADLRDNQLDELESQSVFDDALSSAAPSVSGGDGDESVDEDDDFETEEEAEESEEIEEVESDEPEDAPALVCDGSDSTLDGQSSSVNVKESIISNSESILKQTTSKHSSSKRGKSTSKHCVDNVKGVAAQQDSCTSNVNGAAAQQGSYTTKVNGVAAKRDPRTIKNNGVAAQQGSCTVNVNGVAAKQDPPSISDNGVAAQQGSHTISDGGVAAKQNPCTEKLAPGQKPGGNTPVKSDGEMEYKSVQGSKRPAADDGSSDEPAPSWDDVVVSEEVAEVAARLSTARGPAHRKKSKPPLTLSRKVPSVAGRATTDDSTFKAGRPRRRASKQS